MTIHTVLCARNEADVLEAYVRHSAQWSATILIVLHRCQDNSAEILDRLKAAALPVDYEPDDRLLHEHGVVMTQLAYRAAGAGADWILPLDADEFLVGPVREFLRNQPPTAPIEVPWRCYVPLPDDVAVEPNVLVRIQHRRASEAPQWSKVLVPGELLRDCGGYRLGYGSHQLHDVAGRLVPATRSPLSLAHFPVRSRNQIRSKVFGGWLSNVADVTRPTGNTFQWKAILEESKGGRPVTSSRLRDIALEYGTYRQWNQLPPSFRKYMPGVPPRCETVKQCVLLDPVPCNFAVSLPVRLADPMDVLIETSEAFAAAFGVLYRQSMT